MRILALTLACAGALAAAPAAAQQPFGQGPYDPAVPTPRSVLGYEVGERFTPHHMLSRYLDRVAAASRRVRVDTVAHTFEGRELYQVTLTSEANQARLGQIRADAGRLADPRGASAAELAAITRRMPPVIWLGFSVHGGEASGAEAAIALIYQLAAGQDPETRMLLDSLVVLIDPLENPDGHARHVAWVAQHRGAFGVPLSPDAMIHDGAWPGPRTNHYYFDMNRDWFIQSQPETRGRIATMLTWWPMVAADLHEQGTNATYYFAPPMPPVNKNVQPVIARWWETFGLGNAAAFDRHGWSFFRREGYDEFYPGYGDSWPILIGSVGMTYEQASSAGGAIRRDDGTILTLHAAAFHHYTAAWATLTTAASRSRQLVRDWLGFRQAAVSDGERGPLRSVIIERDETGRADSLAARLLVNGVEVRRLRAAADVRDATRYGESAPRATRVPAGAYVVDMAQPQGRLAKALLEPEAELDSAFIREELENRRTGFQGDRFYDLTAWALPYAYRVRAWWSRGPVPGTEPVTADALARGPAAPPPRARYGYAFRPGSDASVRMLAGLLADSVRVWYAPRAFTQGTERFAQGAFVVRAEANGPGVHDIVRRRQAESGAIVAALATSRADSGTDLGSNSVVPLRPPRVALLGGAPVSGNSFGAAWYAFDRRFGYAVTPVAVRAIAGALRDFDVVVVPSASAGGLDDALGDRGRARLQQWVREGGTLIVLDGAMSWLATERLGLARIRVRRDTTRADSSAGAPLPASAPGAIVRAAADTLSPLMAGIRETELPVLINSSRIYNPPRDIRAGEAVLRLATEPRLRLSGYLWPELPARLAESVYLWTESEGRGRVIGFAADPNFRDMFRGLQLLFANAVFIGPSM